MYRNVYTDSVLGSKADGAVETLAHEVEPGRIEFLESFVPAFFKRTVLNHNGWNTAEPPANPTGLAIYPDSIKDATSTDDDGTKRKFLDLEIHEYWSPDPSNFEFIEEYPYVQYLGACEKTRAFALTKRQGVLSTGSTLTGSGDIPSAYPITSYEWTITTNTVASVVIRLDWTVSDGAFTFSGYCTYTFTTPNRAVTIKDEIKALHQSTESIDSLYAAWVSAGKTGSQYRLFTLDDSETLVTSAPSGVSFGTAVEESWNAGAGLVPTEGTGPSAEIYLAEWRSTVYEINALRVKSSERTANYATKTFGTTTETEIGAYLNSVVVLETTSEVQKRLLLVNSSNDHET